MYLIFFPISTQEAELHRTERFDSNKPIEVIGNGAIKDGTGSHSTGI